MDPIHEETQAVSEATAVPEIQSGAPEAEAALAAAPEAPPPAPEPPQPMETRILLNILMGPQGLRAGWSVALFAILSGIFGFMVGSIFVLLKLISVDPKAASQFTATGTLFGELAAVAGIVGAAAVVALIERRRGNLLAFNLLGPHRVRRFVEGFVAGFLALSALIGAMTWGGWLKFGPVALSGGQIFKFAALWGVAFSACRLHGRGHIPLLSAIHADTRPQLLDRAGHCGADLPEAAYFFNSGNGIWGVYILAGLER